jgi:hypothetical protein
MRAGTSLDLNRDRRSLGVVAMSEDVDPRRVLCGQRGDPPSFRELAADEVLADDAARDPVPRQRLWRLCGIRRGSMRHLVGDSTTKE